MSGPPSPAGNPPAASNSPSPNGRPTRTIYNSQQINNQPNTNRPILPALMQPMQTQPQVPSASASRSNGASPAVSQQGRPQQQQQQQQQPSQTKSIPPPKSAQTSPNNQIFKVPSVPPAPTTKSQQTVTDSNRSSGNHPSGIQLAVQSPVLDTGTKPGANPIPLKQTVQVATYKGLEGDLLY